MAARTVCLMAALAVLGLVSSGARAAEPSASKITIAEAWARPTIGSSTEGVVYLTITNSGTADDRLAKLATPAATSAELHMMTTEGGMMRMRALKELTIPAGETISLAPGGDHIMLSGVVKPLHGGDAVTLTLSFDRAGDLTVDVPVMTGAPAVMQH